jgi:hypothetical protein
MKRHGNVLVIAGIALLPVLFGLSSIRNSAVCAVRAAETSPAVITIDYPRNVSVFPPEITPPTIIWHDSSASSDLWRIDITFGDGSSTLHFVSQGKTLSIGEIDKRCISANNELPTLTPEQQSAHTWIPGASDWEKIKVHSVSAPAEIAITGITQNQTQHALSTGEVAIRSAPLSFIATCR